MTDRKKILIIEDDASVRLGLDVMLRREFETTTAQDGASALASARRTVPDLILLDLGLPCGDGFAVLERLKNNEALASIPVIVLSGREEEVYEDRAIEAGARAYFEKPADQEQLMDAIEAIL